MAAQGLRTLEGSYSKTLPVLSEVPIDDRSALAPSLISQAGRQSIVSHKSSILSTFSDARRLTVPSVKESREGSASATSTTLNIICGGFGTGLLSLPWSTAGASLLSALVIMAAVLVLNVWTISILVRAAERHQTFDIGGLLAQCPRGRLLQALSNIMVWATMFLCLIGYMVASTASAERAGIREALGVERWVIVVAAAALAFPLCFLDMRYLAFTSGLTVVVNVYLMVLISVYFVGNVEEDSLPWSCLLFFGQGDIAMVSAMMQAVTIQMCVLPMYAELEDRSPEKFSRCVNVAFFSLFVIFAGFSVLAELNFGTASRSNILLNISKDLWGTMSQIGMIVSITAVYPIMLSPMIAPVRNSANYEKLAIPVTTAIVAGSAVAALFISDLGFLNVVNGSGCMGMFVGIVPSVVGWYLLELPWYGMSTLLVCALVMSVMGLIYTSNFVGDIEHGCYWALDRGPR